MRDGLPDHRGRGVLDNDGTCAVRCGVLTPQRTQRALAAATLAAMPPAREERILRVSDGFGALRLPRLDRFVPFFASRLVRARLLGLPPHPASVTDLLDHVGFAEVVKGNQNPAVEIGSNLPVFLGV